MGPDLFRVLKNSRVQSLAALASALVFTPTVWAAFTSYSVTNLVSDQTGVAAHVDTDLVNPWGIAFNPNGFVWIANNGSGTSTLYDGHGVKNTSLVVNVPLGGGGNPTGIVFNSSNGFKVTNGTTSGASAFIFATESGKIAGWSPGVNFNNALVANTSTNGAIYKGLAIGSGPSPLLYAADFHNGTVSVFDQAFQPTTVSGGFADPTLPSGYAPFGIQNINGDLYVTYAKQGSGGDEQDGAGLGLVDKFDATGKLLAHVVAPNGPLNAPWGLALAPANFGPFSNALLVGNFGDGTINAFNATTGSFLGQLRDAHGNVLSLDGLWGISFGNGIMDQPVNTLFATAGPGDEAHGLYVRIDAVPEPSAALLTLAGVLCLLVVGRRRTRSRM